VGYDSKTKQYRALSKLTAAKKATTKPAIDPAPKLTLKSGGGTSVKVTADPGQTKGADMLLYAYDPSGGQWLLLANLGRNKTTRVFDMYKPVQQRFSLVFGEGGDTKPTTRKSKATTGSVTP